MYVYTYKLTAYSDTAEHRSQSVGAAIVFPESREHSMSLVKMKMKSVFH